MSDEKHRLQGLIIAPFVTLPADHGNKVHADAHIRQLKEMGHDIWYLAVGREDADVAAMTHEWQDRFIHDPKITRTFAQQIWRGLQRRLRSWRGQPPPLDYWFTPGWLRTTEDLVARVQFDYVIVHYIFLTRFFEAFPTSVRKIIDTHDSFGDRRSKFTTKGVDYAWWHCSQSEEIKGLRRGDYIMANQPEEAAHFEHLLKGSRKVVTVGHPSVWNPRPEPHQPALGFLASDNLQNQAGLLWFLENCWPLVMGTLPDVQLIIGGLIGDSAGLWHDTPGVRVLGRVDEVNKFHDLTTVEINPVSVGSGLKIKTMETLAAGRALVSVSEGVAGLSRDFDAFVVADDAKQFSTVVISLLRNPKERSRLVGNAHRLLDAWNERQENALASLFAGCGRSDS